MTNEEYNKLTLEQKEAYIRSMKEPICPNCNQRGLHFMPPSLSEEGFYACEVFNNG